MAQHAYTVEFQYSSGIPNSPATEPQPVDIFTSLEGAKGAFITTAKACLVDGKTEAEGGPIGWLYRADLWDSAWQAYPIEALVGTLTYGPRGGVVLTWA